MSLLLRVAALATVTCLVFGQDSCISPTGIDGRCVSLNDCAKIKNLTRGSTSDREILKQWHCGFIGEVPMVCCPIKVPTTISSLPEGKCVTIEGTSGTCVALEACPNVAKKLRENREDSLKYVLGSRCLGTAPYSVCCESPVVTNAASQISQMCPVSSGLPEPSGECCGENSGGEIRIIQGSRAYIDQYPWMAIIEYSLNDYECAGSLISSQYVLTAAHCILKPSKKLRRTRSVRLGEFDTTNDGPDCVEIGGGDKDCTDGAVSIPVAATFAHPDYNTDTTLKTHDIGLIKLTEMAPYNDFIRPICLPTSDITKSLSRHDYTRFFVSGWGPVETQSSVKLHVELPYVNETRCQQVLNANGKQTVWNKICSGESHKDRCKGQTGGPLMYYNVRKYELAGVISSDPSSCITMLVSTKVYDYVPWIKSIVNS